MQENKKNLSSRAQKISKYSALEKQFEQKLTWLSSVVSSPNYQMNKCRKNYWNDFFFFGSKAHIWGTVIAALTKIIHFAIPVQRS